MRAITYSRYGGPDVLELILIIKTGDAEADRLCRATRYERTDEPSTYRNGSRPRLLSTRRGHGCRTAGVTLYLDMLKARV